MQPMSALRIARIGLLVGFLCYLATLAASYLRALDPSLVVILSFSCMLVMAFSALAAVILQIWSVTRSKS